MADLAFLNTIAQRHLYAREMWKRNVISTGRRTIHPNPSRKQSSSKTLFKRLEFENKGFAF